MSGDTVHLNAVGAKANGRKDNTPVFQRALDMGVRTIVLDKGVYYISKPLIVNNPDVEIIGQGQGVTTITGDRNQLFDIRNAPVLLHKSSLPVSEGVSSVDFTQPVDNAKSMILHIRAPHGMPESTSGGYTSHHTAVVRNSEGSKMHLDRALEIPFRHDIEYSIYRPARFTMRDLTLESDFTPYLVQIHNRQNVLFQNVVFRTPRKKYMGVFREGTPQLGVSAIGAYGCMDLVVDSCRFEHIWYGLMAHQGCYNVSLQNSRAFESRHISNNGIGTDHFKVENCVAEACEGGFNSHPTALGTTFINCQDLHAKAPSTFDGRRDSIINCVFDQGFRLSTDPGILSLVAQPGSVFKVISGCKVNGGTVQLSGANLDISDTEIYTPVLPFDIAGKFQLKDVTIDVSQRKDVVSSAITIADTPAEGHTYHFRINGLRVLGSEEHNPSETFGIYIPMRDGVSGEFSDVVINGFYKGLVLYGGEEAKEGYRKISMENVLIMKCHYGIYQQDFFDKPLQKADIRFQECTVDDNAPGRIQYTAIPKN